MRRPLSLAAALAILMFCALPLILLAGARVNVTSSFPPGVYWVVDKVPERGDLVLFCPPQRDVFDLARERGYLQSGTCPGGYMRMLKRLAAIAGDEVLILPEGISVNGQVQERSQPLALDPSGRNMPHPQFGKLQVAADEALLLSDYNRYSFDGRYFGAVPMSQVEEVIRPVLVWGRPRD